MLIRKYCVFILSIIIIIITTCEPEGHTGFYLAVCTGNPLGKKTCTYA